MLQYNIIDINDTNLSIFDRSCIYSLHDVLMRAPPYMYTARNHYAERTRVLRNGDKFVGYINYSLYDMVVFRDRLDGYERLALASVIEFPVADLLDKRIWTALINYSIEDLRSLGAHKVYIYIPIRFHRYRNFLKGIGFEESTFCDNIPYLLDFGYDETCSVFIRDIGFASKPDIYPYAIESFIQLRADIRDNPVSNSIDWSKAYLYSGYSGYPFFSDFLNKIIDPNVKSLLSVPCATGDVLRFLPVDTLRRLEKAVGVDAIMRSVDFAQERIRHPYIDVFNRFLCWVFYKDIQGYITNLEVISILSSIWSIYKNDFTEDDLLHVYSQMRSMFRKGVISGAVADWFCLCKGLSQALFSDTNIEMFDKITRMVSLLDANFFHSFIKAKDANFVLQDDCLQYHQEYQDYLDQGKIELICDSMYNLDLDQQFDVIIVWEAALMVVADDRHNEFIEMLLRHLSSTGYIVVTGIRTFSPSKPHELTVLQKEFLERGYLVTTTDIRFQPSHWTFRSIQETWCPILVVKRAS